MALHGLGGTGEGTMKLTGFNEVADKEGFVVVYPDGLNRLWKCNGFSDDDVNFLSSLIDYLEESLNLDKNRIYVAGMSNGGLMCYRLATEIPDKIAAIAPVVASMTSYQEENFSPPKAISVLIMNGTEDPIMPWNGGNIVIKSEVKFGSVISTYDTVKFWVENNNCSSEAEIKDMEDKDPGDGAKVREEIYPGGDNNTEVILYAIEGGGHNWPGAFRYGSEERIGKTCYDIDGSEVIWEFFKRHKLDDNYSQ